MFCSPSWGSGCANLARTALRPQSPAGVAALIGDPRQGAAGNVIPPPEFLQRAQDIAREFGAGFIADEMITGFGRTGRWFACERSGVTPDAITLGKGFGSGFPISGVVAKHELAQAKPWANPSGSSSSYGGNPLAAAAALASIRSLQRENGLEDVRGGGGAVGAGPGTLPGRPRSG